MWPTSYLYIDLKYQILFNRTHTKIIWHAQMPKVHLILPNHVTYTRVVFFFMISLSQKKIFLALSKRELIHPINPQNIRGKMEHRDRMEHRVFEKEAWYAWVYFHVHLCSVIDQFSIIHRNQICNRPHFKYLTKTQLHLLIYQFTRVLTSDALTSYVVEPLHVSNYNDVPLFRIFTSYWLSNGWYHS